MANNFLLNNYLCSSDLLTINFAIQHIITTTAEAQNLTLRFFIPPYLSVINSSINLSNKLTTSQSNDMLLYTVS